MRQSLQKSFICILRANYYLNFKQKLHFCSTNNSYYFVQERKQHFLDIF